MLGAIYELFMSFVTFILGLFGLDMKKKSVSFADEVEKKEEVQTQVQAEAEAKVQEETRVEENV
jgi:hypothetical protein